MKKNYYWIMLLLLLGVSVATWLYLSRPTTTPTATTQKQTKTETASALVDAEEEEALLIDESEEDETEAEKRPFVMPEDADDPRIAYSADGNVRIEFVGPEGDTFEKSQARMWSLDVQRQDENIAGRSQMCTWIYSFGEVVYETMEDNKVCAFTSTFINQRGPLDVVVKYDILQGRSVFDDEGNYVEYVQDVIESLTVQRTFQVL